MKKVRCIYEFSEDITVGKIYDVLEYKEMKYCKYLITIISNGGVLCKYNMRILNSGILNSGTEYIYLFEDVTSEYRCLTINEILN